jgi:hypothetical protein
MGSGWLRSYVLGITRLFRPFQRFLEKAIFERNYIQEFGDSY